MYGAGAIGGTLAVKLAQAGHDVCLVARGAHLAAIKEHGLKLQSRLPGTAVGFGHGTDGGNSNNVVVQRLAASSNAADFGQQDVVILAMKAHSLSAAAAGIAPLLGPATTVFTAMNGVPWWMFDQWGPAALRDTSLRACDPEGNLRRHIPSAHVVGGVVYMSADVPEPGLVRHNAGNRIVVGEPLDVNAATGDKSRKRKDSSSSGGSSSDGITDHTAATNTTVSSDPLAGESNNKVSERVQALVSALRGCGIDAEPSASIRHELWHKLLGNLSFNPTSLLTGAACDRMISDPYVRQLLERMMKEGLAVGDAMGIRLGIEPAARMEVTRKLGAVKTSMLQDAEAARPIELDGIVASVVEIAHKVGVEVPSIEAVLGLVRVRASILGLYSVPEV